MAMHTGLVGWEDAWIGPTDRKTDRAWEDLRRREGAERAQG